MLTKERIYSEVLPAAVKECAHNVVSYSLLDLQIVFYLPREGRFLLYVDVDESELDYASLVDRAWDNAERELVLNDFLLTFDYATYASGYYGAGVIASKKNLERIKEKLGCNYFILPSSVHEVIVISEKGTLGGDADEFIKIVKAVNATPEVINPTDVLSDTVYYYGDHGLEIYKK